MNSAPLVSIAIPAYTPRFFHAALSSALSQTYSNLEVIVCDDSRGSEIKTIVDACQQATDISIRYVRNAEHLGMVGNLHACLNEAKGEFIKFLCDDDLLFPACIAVQAAALVDYPDASLVSAQRMLWDADDLHLPKRLENSPLAPGSSIFKGDDLLAILEGFPVNFLGGFSSVLFRGADIQELMPALTQPGHCFVASLDLALQVCLLRRGNLVLSNDVLGVERLHPNRLSGRQSMKDSLLEERKWLRQMIKGRAGESAPAFGWVRYLPLNRAGKEPRIWEELPLSRSMGTQQSTLPWNVGVNAQNFSELYAEWLSCRKLSESAHTLLPDTLDGWSWRPKIVPVVIDDQPSGAGLMLTLDSLDQQVYPPHLVVVLSARCTETALDQNTLRMPLQEDWSAQLNEIIGQLDGADWLHLLRAGDRLSDTAMLIVAERVVAHPDAMCIYSDEGGLRDGESVEPVFKPDFNLDMMRSYVYVGRNLAFDRERLLAVGGFDSSFGELSPHDALWRLVEEHGTQVVEHVSEILVESSQGLIKWLALPQVVEQNRAVLVAHLQRLGVAHELRQDPAQLINRVDYLHAQRPLVSIIIACKDQMAALQRCAESLLEKTAYSEYELLLVDNGSEQPDILAWLDGMAQLGSDRLRVLRYPSQGNIAALRNFAALQARGDYLLFLSPMAVVTTPDWLDELLNHGQRPEVAVVGAKLFDPSGNLASAGLILGLQGPAGAAFIGAPGQSAGYMSRLQIVQNLSAVGAECMLIRKAVFDELGGLDEQSYEQTLGEVDLCLRIGQQGYLVVWTPHARLALGNRQPQVIDSVAQTQQALEQKNFYQRWLPVVARDPAYNVNLTLNAIGGGSYCLDPGLKTGWRPFLLKQLPVIAALPINASAVGHYRVNQPLAELQAAGRVTGGTYYSTPSIIEFERLNPDVIILQLRYSQGQINEMESIKNYLKARRVFEIDDYVIEATKKNLHTRNKAGPEETERLLRKAVGLCDRVVASTHALAETLASMHDDIRVVPNMLATHLWSDLHSRRRVSAKPRVGWGGGTSHSGDLEIIADVVRELANEVEWVFFGMCPEELRPYIHEFHGIIDMEVYPAKLASLNLDLALAPLEFHIFNDCKSNLRLLEYGACGYPVVCSDTRAYRGYLPCTRVVTNSTQEWLEAIRMHLADPDASYRMGDQLREIVLRDFILRGDNLENWINGWLAD
ncbi:glycosyltransferase [Pseudomonas sp. CDFA 602]|uniref:glycosyltransferase n=1 Tax=Pseudomonas californiensis TaxID=2829823 RepID=UPI001E4B6710|nr:glycosyltransferase [Pseudomonas californiensis]MCD5992976.1 glycosyltransferase [Pseudomonas californiensis]MCD5998353.1 glycosyltransferase [Pseudomonas californiensis]